MPFIDKDIVFQRFLARGRNSSHFVWNLTQLKFFQTQNDWIFAYKEQGKTMFFALEPLFPAEAEAELEKQFSIAWQEVESSLKPKIAFFVSVYEPFLKILAKNHFQRVQVGREPYIELSECIPTGKSGKGVRAARNQALRSGVSVEEWSEEKLQSEPRIAAKMKSILHYWHDRNLFQIGGFLNTVNPFVHMSHRRYFLAFNKKRELEAYLIASPIPQKNSYFLEDMVVRPGASRGVGELLSLEAMVALSESKASYASLGVVAQSTIDVKTAESLPPTAKLFIVKVPNFVSQFYNMSGLETFRKRFKPKFWEHIYLAQKNYPSSGLSDSAAWFWSMISLLKCFDPKINISIHWFKALITKPLSRYPITYFVTAIASLLFFTVNKGDALPPWALDKLGFTGSAPYSQWLYRSIASDFLYFDRTHFIASTIMLFFLIRWMERTHRFQFLVWFTSLICVFDDFCNHFILIKPFEYFRPRVFQALVAEKDVGGSLWIAAFIGLQICQIKRNREILFAITTLGSVLCFVFGANHLSNLVLNLNHFLFLVFGFVVGKIRYQQDRQQSKKVAKQKPPEAKSVAKAAITQS